MQRIQESRCFCAATSMFNSTCESPACSVPPGPVKSSSLLVQMWSRKSSITFWFSSAPMKRFHLSVFTRSTQKACSLRKSTLSSDNTTPTLRDGTCGVCAPVLLVPKPPASLLELLPSAMRTREEKLKWQQLGYLQCWQSEAKYKLCKRWEPSLNLSC